MKILIQVFLAGVILSGSVLYANSMTYNYKIVDTEDDEPDPTSKFVNEFSVVDLIEDEVLRVQQQRDIAELEIHRESEKSKQKERDNQNRLASRSGINRSALENRKYRVEKLIVTAYAPFDNKSGICNDGDPTKTSTGSYPQHGTIAVNPKRFPYGTKFYIEGYGYGEGLDTGGEMRKNSRKIDLFVDTYEQAINWGKREIEVIIFED